MALAVGELWPELPASFAEDWDNAERQLLVLLRQLEGGPADRAQAEHAIARLFETSPAARQRLIEVLAARKPAVLKGYPEGPAPQDRPRRHVIVPVYFATDRAHTGEERPDRQFGGERGEVSFGQASVSVPDDHRMGRIEKPRWWRLEFRPNPDKHVVLLTLVTLDRDGLVGEFAKDQRAGAREALLFVHGYNVSFGAALRRTAQISYDLGFQGIPLLFSWPSRAETAKYTVDETNARWAQPHFRQFIQLLLDEGGFDALHVIAHSMGNRVVAETLRDVRFGPATRLRQVVFAAPDIDSDTFKDLAVSFGQGAERFTLYASSEDKALALSKTVHGYPRAGDSGPNVVVMDGIDTIDATAVDTSLVGHAYYGDNRSILSDMFALVHDGLPPERRFGLRPRQHLAGRYWVFHP